MNRLACSSILAVLLTCAGATGAIAQTSTLTSGGTVPSDVMAVLLQGSDVGSGRAFDLRIGSAPAAFPADLLPAGTRVNATAVGPQATTVVGTLTSYVAADQPAFEAMLTSAGWIEMVSRPKGFTAIVQGVPLTLCRGAEFATVSFAPRMPSGMFVRASVATDASRTCAAPHMSDFSDLPLPSLRPPAGTESSGAAIGGTPDATYTTVRLATTRPVDQIAAHYRDQLTSSGWRVEGEATENGAMSVTRFSTASTGGDPMSGMLVVTALGQSGQVDVLLRLVRNTLR
ncbi:MAG: hypothetical protein R2752_01500 [Vicinamibacterales bacterium]